MDTHIPEKLADYIYDGELDAELIDVESEHSALSACLGAQAAGSRTFTATASQGLALMHEILYVVSGMRLPIVMAVANRTLSAPINIWNDHQDSISERDSGWIQLYVESAQEAFDTTIMAFKIAERKDIMLPVMVCLDGFTLSHVYEPLTILDQKQVDSFLPKYNPKYKLDPKKPVTMGPIGYPNSFMYFKKQQQDAMLNSIKIIQGIFKEFKTKFKKPYQGNGLIETYQIKDAEYAFVAMGSLCGTIREMIDDLRSKGKKVGLIKIKCFRPFPEKDIAPLLKPLKAVAVFDKNISLGYEGALYAEIKSALYHTNTPALIHSFIAGLGGRDITPEQITDTFNKIAKEKKETIEWLF